MQTNAIPTAPIDITEPLLNSTLSNKAQQIIKGDKTIVVNLLKQRNFILSKILEKGDTANVGDASSSPMTQQELDNTITTFNEQYRTIKDLGKELQTLKLNSQPGPLGTEKGSWTVGILTTLSVLSVLGDISVTIVPIFTEDSPVNSIAYYTTMASIVVTITAALTGLAWYFYDKNKAAEDAASQLTKEDIEDTKAILKLLREWQKSLLSDGKNEQETTFLHQLENTNPRALQQIATKEEFQNQFIQSLPSDNQFRQQMEVLNLSTSMQFIENRSSNSRYEEEGDLLSNIHEEYNLANQQGSSSSSNTLINTELEDAYNSIQKKLIRSNIPSINFRGRKIENLHYKKTEKDEIVITINPVKETTTENIPRNTEKDEMPA